MKLRFSPDKILARSKGYEARLRPHDKKLTAEIMQNVFPKYAERGYLTKKELLTVCEWKTPRAQCGRFD